MKEPILFASVYIMLLFFLYALGQRHLLFRRILLSIYVFTTSIYIIWRVGWTLPHDHIVNTVFGIILVSAEVGGFCLAMVFYFIFWKKFKRPVVDLTVYEANYPTVAIFIATYNEDLDILKRSIVAAKLATYPDRKKVEIYLGDDGDRPEIADLAKHLGINYVTRPTHDHAKAGNLNYMMHISQSDLIVTMDADMVMRQDFLEKTIGYFHNPKMGFVQTPQTFFNLDPYQFNLYAGTGIGNDQDFFMRRIEAQKDAFNAVMYVGSNAIFRREALESIGGFTTGVITEDMATGMFLQAKGWQSGFINENLASGLAPETFGDLIKQRDRWARGNIQVAKKWNPLRVKGLTFMQRLLYVDGIHYWFSGIYKMIFLLAPILFLMLGIYSLQTDFEHIIIFWLPAFIASQLAFNLVAEKRQTTMLSNIYEIATAPFMAFAVFNELFLKSKKGFAVTRKGVNSQKSYYNWTTAWPMMLLIVLSILSIIRGIGIVLGEWSDDIPKQGVYINLFWLAYNLFGLILAMYVSNERPRLRQSERFMIPKTVTVNLNGEQHAGELTDWNEYGARISLKNVQASDITEKTAEINLDDVRIAIEIMWQRAMTDGIMIGVTFPELQDEAYALIINQTYGKSSSELQEITFNNRVWHLLVVWWLKILGAQKPH